MIDLNELPDPQWLDANSRLEQYLTVGGRAVESDVSGYFEMYRDTFLEALYTAQLTTDLQLAQVLTRMNKCENVGDFLGEPVDQHVELSGFGLLLLDRMAAIRWGKDDPIACFWLHEQLFECFDYLRDGVKRRETARKAVAARHASTLPAKHFVAAEWLAHRAEYGNNKSAFTRDYVRRIKREFGVEVTEKQLREVWLRDTPSSRKPDGQPVDGE